MATRYKSLSLILSLSEQNIYKSECGAVRAVCVVSFGSVTQLVSVSCCQECRQCYIGQTLIGGQVGGDTLAVNQSHTFHS